MTTYLGKSCSFCLPRVPFVNCRQFMYLVISLLVLRAGYGIWLYQFLIIAYLFTLFILYGAFASVCRVEDIYVIYTVSQCTFIIYLCWIDNAVLLYRLEWRLLECAKYFGVSRLFSLYNTVSIICFVFSLLFLRNVYGTNILNNVYFLNWMSVLAYLFCILEYISHYLVILSLSMVCFLALNVRCISSASTPISEQIFLLS